MEAIKIILFVVLLGYSAYSVISYWSRRGESKSAIQELARRTPVRTLTAEEQEALVPFLLSLQQAKDKLVDVGVRQLAGDFVSHGLSVQGNDTTHDTLGGVEVLLPYDAKSFIAESNRADVVVGGKVAIVVGLNGAFDLLGGRERALKSKEEQRDWAKGKAGPATPGFAANAVGLIDGVEEPIDIQPLVQVNVLSQRDETPAEALDRVGVGYASAAVSLFSLAAIAWLIAGAGLRGAAGQALLAAGILLAMAGCWFLRRRRKPVPQKVNRVEGMLFAVEVTSAANSGVTTTQTFLGDRFPLVFPPRWTSHITVPSETQVVVDMRVEDYSVVAVGRQFSITNEHALAAPVYWGRYLVLAILGAVFAVIAWVLTPEQGVVADALHVKSVLKPGGIRRITQATDAQAAPPAAGDMVHLQVKAACQIGESSGVNPAPVDCSRLRAGGSPLAWAPLSLDQQLQDAYEGKSLDSRSDIRLSYLLGSASLRPGVGGSYLPNYAPAPDIHRIRRVGAFITSLNSSCAAAGTAAEPCKALRSLLQEKVLQMDGEKLDLAKVGIDDEAIASGTTVLQIRAHLRALHQHEVSRALEPQLKALVASQRGGILIQSTQPVDATPPQSRSDDWIAQWDAYQKLGEASALHEVDRQGMVTLVQNQADGALHLAIDETRTPARVYAAMARLLLLALGLALLLWYLPLAVMRIKAARARQALLVKSYENVARRML